MNKDKLVNIFEKYNLNKTIEQACLDIKDKELKVNFSSPNKDLVGFLTSDIDLADNNIGIYSTSKLLSLLNITDGELNLSFETKNRISTKINISDAHYKLSYSLADPFIISKIEEVKEPPNPTVTVDLDQEFIERFLKAKKALGDESKVVLTLTYENGVGVIRFILGGNEQYTNKVQFDFPAEFEKDMYDDYIFSSAYLKEIFSAHKAAESLQLVFFKEGLLKLVGEEKDANLKVIYYILKENEE